jgi:hypothetical protein
MFIFQVFVSTLFMLIFTLIADALAFKCNLPRLKYSGKTSGRDVDE